MEKPEGSLRKDRSNKHRTFFWIVLRMPRIKIQINGLFTLEINKVSKDSHSLSGQLFQRQDNVLSGDADQTPSPSLHASTRAAQPVSHFTPICYLQKGSSLEHSHAHTFTIENNPHRTKFITKMPIYVANRLKKSAL